MGPKSYYKSSHSSSKYNSSSNSGSSYKSGGSSYKSGGSSYKSGGSSYKSGGSSSSGSGYSIYCDGASNRDTKGYGHASVFDSSGNNLVSKYSNELRSKNYDIITTHTPKYGHTEVIRTKYNDVSSQQNNGAELAGTRAAYEISKMITNEGRSAPSKIYSDSKLVTDYWSNGHCNASKLSSEKVSHINDLRSLKSSSSVPLEYVPSKNNVADLGYKGR